MTVVTGHNNPDEETWGPNVDADGNWRGLPPTIEDSVAVVLAESGGKQFTPMPNRPSHLGVCGSCELEATAIYDDDYICIRCRNLPANSGT